MGVHKNLSEHNEKNYATSKGVHRSEKTEIQHFFLSTIKNPYTLHLFLLLTKNSLKTILNHRIEVHQVNSTKIENGEKLV